MDSEYSLNAGERPESALLSDLQNRKRVRKHGTASATSATPRCIGWGLRRGRTILRRHGQDVIGFGIESQTLGARHRLEILLHHETRRAVLFDYGQSSVAVRAECLHG